MCVRQLPGVKADLGVSFYVLKVQFCCKRAPEVLTFTTGNFISWLGKGAGGLTVSPGFLPTSGEAVTGPVEMTGHLVWSGHMVYKESVRASKLVTQETAGQAVLALLDLHL